MENFIVVKDVSYTVEDQTILRDVNFSINRKKIYVLIGPNGGGKTILLKLLAGIYQPTAGEITATIDNKILPIHEAIYNHVLRAGFVFEHGGLINNMSIYENIMLPMKYFGALTKSEIEERYDRIVKELGLEKYAASRPAQLSLGTRKLANIGMSVANGPHIIFYDNPTLGLDIASSQSIKSLIKVLHREYNVTSIIATNNLYFARQIADTAAFVDREVVEFDTVDNILNSNNPRVQQYLCDIKPV